MTERVTDAIAASIVWMVFNFVVILLPVPDTFSAFLAGYTCAFLIHWWEKRHAR